MFGCYSIFKSYICLFEMKEEFFELWKEGLNMKSVKTLDAKLGLCLYLCLLFLFYIFISRILFWFMNYFMFWVEMVSEPNFVYRCK